MYIAVLKPMPIMLDSKFRVLGGPWSVLFFIPWFNVPVKVSAHEGYDTGSFPAMVLVNV